MNPGKVQVTSSRLAERDLLQLGPARQVLLVDEYGRYRRQRSTEGVPDDLNKQVCTRLIPVWMLAGTFKYQR